MAHTNRLTIDGKFFSLDGERTWIKCVCYGPFPDPQPDVFAEFKRIREAGFNSIRLYESPSNTLLEAALENDLLIFAGINWQWRRVFLGADTKRFWHEGCIEAMHQLSIWGNHPAIVAIYIANEIPSSIARWIGPTTTRESLDKMIEVIKEALPHLLLGYANYPSSAYLEPTLADFTALNLYIEDPQKLTHYLNHAHHMAGDRPLLISECGLDSMRNGVDRQKEVLAWQLQLIRSAGCAGATLFSWSDRWRSGSDTVDDWQFGLTDITGLNKPVLDTVSGEIRPVTLSVYPMFSVIICVHNGSLRI